LWLKDRRSPTLKTSESRFQTLVNNRMTATE
jgi:hypothetical protein